MLLKDAIFSAKDLPVEKLTIPAWGGDVFLRVITSEEKDAWERSWFVGEGEERREDMHNLSARFAVLVLCDESGKRIFTDSEAGALGQKSGAALSKIWEAGRKLNKMGKDAAEKEIKN